MWAKSRDLDENKAIFVQMWIKSRDLDENKAIFVQMWVKSGDLDENKAIFVQMWVKSRDLDKNTTEGLKNSLQDLHEVPEHLWSARKRRRSALCDALLDKEAPSGRIE
jgi:hypothetical protein